MTGETVCIGAIGAGAISEYHLAGLQAAGGADVRVISGRHIERIVPVAEKYGIPDVVTDYRVVLDRDDVNAVIITTPENTHEEIAVAAARAGKAILLQKPIADSADACERIIQATIRAGVSLQVSFMHRYFEEVVYARDLLRSGELGDLHAIRMRNATPGPDKAWYYDSAIAAGGVVFSLGVHGIDLIQHLFGAIGSVAARTATMVRERTMPDGETVRNIELEDHALASYCLANGVLGSHEMSACEVQGTDRFLLEIYCEKGSMVLRGHHGPLAICAPRVRGTSLWITPDLPRSSFGARHHAHWLDIVRGASRADATAWDALAGMRVVEAIYAAAENGTRISVPPVKDADYAS